ncbi:TPA: restriction endonuclease subunit S [Vibrio cholerae]|uniref:restriction endonuclease subunit S n=1 Tax=Vibrio cholerae TaxID=666 RepID=UPI000B2A0CC9|nr:restriction endonuclease subunit S [Vibrio cholerae]
MIDTMIKQMPKYESYKESGIEWLDEVPQTWQTSKLKYLASIFTGDSISPTLKDTYVSTELSGRAYIASKDIDVQTSRIDYENGVRIPFDRRHFKVAPEQSTLLCIEGGSAGKKIAYTAQDVCFVNKLACIASEKVLNKYLYYSLFSEPFQSQFKLSMSGLIGGVSVSSINNFIVVVPPEKEQIRIVSYLDKKVSQLNEAIYIKQQQIERLRERKHVIIQQAVTQGLETNVPMQDSGVDWIGEIPKHWGIVRFKNLFTQSRLPVRKGDGVVTSYRDGQVTLRSNRRVGGYTEAIFEGGYQGIRKGQLVLNSMDAFEGAIGVSDSDGKCTPEYVICDPINSVNVSQYYFAYLLREMALAKYIQVICNAVRQRAVRIRYNNLAPLFMVVPPVKEQEDIVSFIEKESAKLDAGIKHLNEQISKLKEYKTTLINSAVTGKIKVTELV